jgi:hypothetical protein
VRWLGRDEMRETCWFASCWGASEATACWGAIIGRRLLFRKHSPPTFRRQLILIELRIREIEYRCVFDRNATERQGNVALSVNGQPVSVLSTACDTHESTVTTGSDCSTKNPEPKFGFGRPNLEEKAWLDVDATGGTLWVGAAQHIPLHVKPFHWFHMGASLPFTGERSTVGR